MTRANNLEPAFRRLTSEPGYHWFGYYDKLEFDPTCRFVACDSAHDGGRQIYLGATGDRDVCLTGGAGG